MRLPVFEPITKGVLLAFFSVVVASIGAAFFLGAVPPASPDLLQSLALIGAILLPAYVVEVIWLVPRMGQGEELEEWLGFVVGAAIADLLAIAVALLGVQHRLAGHSNSLDDLGLAFVIVSLVVLAGTLVAQPLLAHRFCEHEPRRPYRSPSSERDGAAAHQRPDDRRRLGQLVLARPARAANGEASIVATVSRLQWQPSARKRQGFSRRSCQRARPGSSARTCSTKSSLPPGFSTRAASASAAAGSGTVQRTRVKTAVSKLSSSNGRLLGRRLDHRRPPSRSPQLWLAAA